MFEFLEEIIAKSPRLKAFPGQDVSNELIADAEKQLGLALPLSYKHWLREYGNLSIGADQVFTLASIEDREIADDDLIYNARLVEENDFPPAGLLPVYVPDSDEAFYFDTRQGLVEGEYPIVRFDYNDGTFSTFSDSFVEFLMDIARQSA